MTLSSGEMMVYTGNAGKVGCEYQLGDVRESC